MLMRFSNEEIEIVKQYYPDNGASKTAEILNGIFGTNRDSDSIKRLASKHKIRCSELYLKNRLSKSSKERFDRIGRPNGFKQKPHEKGFIRLETVNGVQFYRMKTSTGWKTAGRAVWEQHNGPIPKGYKIIYLDGNSLNYDISNLVVVSPKVQYQIIRNKSYKLGDPELTKTLIKYYELRNAIGINSEQFRTYMRKFEKILDKEDMV